MMSLELFKKIIDDLGKYLVRIHLYKWGEPFLNNDVYEMIRYAHNHHIVTYVSTNFTLFSDEAAERLIASGLDEIILSIDGVSQESYEKYRVGGDFRKVIDNISILVNAKRRRRSFRPFIMWQFIVFKHNEHEVETAKQMAKELGVDGISFMPAMVPINNREEAERWLPLDSKYQRYDVKKMEEVWSAQEMQKFPTNGKSESDTRERSHLKRKVGCPWLWTQTSINWDGTVSPCCDIFDSSFDFGTMADKPFKDVWNNEKYRASRRFSSKGKLGGLRTICMECPGVLHEPPMNKASD
jgi:radical SAM protein with 4Fe4S-binding SPASM domain